MKKLLFTLFPALALGFVLAPAAEEILHHDAEAISKAREGMEREIPVARTDPHRPVYHFLPEARWINDPNGVFLAKGWYHVFYQHNPYGNGWGHMHWGHARSRDNVNWERLPVAVWPSTETGEDHCYSGSAAQDGDGNRYVTKRTPFEEFCNDQTSAPTTIPPASSFDRVGNCRCLCLRRAHLGLAPVGQ